MRLKREHGLRGALAAVTELKGGGLETSAATGDKGASEQEVAAEHLPPVDLTDAAQTEFDFSGLAIRTYSANDETWFVAADVCAVLEHTDPSKAVSRLDVDEKGATNVRTLGGDQMMRVVTESGLYALILTSRKPQAKAFRRWVTQIVLPTIRKTGRYHGSAQPVTLTSTAGLGQTTVGLPSYGRFVVMNTPSGGVQVDNALYAIARDFAALDCRVLSHKVKAIQGFWLRYKQLTSLGEVCVEGYTRQSLEEAITDAATHAQRYILAYERDQEDVTKQ